MLTKLGFKLTTSGLTAGVATNWATGARPFPSYRQFLMPLQHTTFETIVTKGEIAHYEKKSAFVTMFLHLFNKSPPIHGDFSLFCQDISKGVCCRVVVCGKWLINFKQLYHLFWNWTSSLGGVFFKDFSCIAEQNGFNNLVGIKIILVKIFQI